ncbi:MAG: hypothetical protein ACYCEI_14635 [Enterococcus faecalis]
MAAIKKLFAPLKTMKLTTEKINELLGVDESFHASYKLIEEEVKEGGAIEKSN